MFLPDFKNIEWKDFERLCADLLSAEGFIIESEPSIDHTGTDITAKEEYRSHDPTRSISIRWRVQCKHYAGSGKSLGRNEVEKSLYNFEAIRRPDEGLFLIVDTDYTEPASEVIDKYLQQHPGTRITLWNQRQLATRLERHKHLFTRYGLSYPKADYLSVFSSLEKLGSFRVLIISDQSAMAHNLTSGLRTANFDITFLPFWNYQEPVRVELILSSISTESFHLVICFLGDSFGLPIPHSIIEIIEHSYNEGAAVLFFPFFAWSLNKGSYKSLRNIIPVRLEDPNKLSLDVVIDRVFGNYRRGDFSPLIGFDFFAEDHYIELDPSDGILPFIDGIKTRFGLSHTFEYLKATDGSKIGWEDTTGNPIVVFNNSGKGKVCYLNTCCHACLSTIPVSSPIEASMETAILTKNVIQWLLDKN
jgi:hypothetical protein